MGRPQQVDDAHVFVAARAVLVDSARLTTALVAQRAGVSEALLFKRYGSKAGLLRAVMEDALTSMLASIEHAGRTPLDEAGLARLAMNVLAHIRLFVPMALTHMKEPLASPQLEGDDPPPMRALRALTSTIATQMESGALRESDPTTVARVIIGGIWQYAFEDALMRLRGRKSKVSARALTTRLASFLWTALAPVGDPS